jgi:formiminotetrahydrofolate cyclodeaminase
MLAGKLSYLAGAISSDDLRPTDQHHEVHKELKAELAEYQQELQGLLQNELPAFNEVLDENQLPRIAIGGESGSPEF